MSLKVLYQNFSQSSIDIKEELNQILNNPGKYYVNETVDLPWSYLRLVVHKAQYTKWHLDAVFDLKGEDKAASLKCIFVQNFVVVLNV